MKWPFSDIGHRTGQGHCWEKENNKPSPLIAPAYSLERIPRPQHSKGKPRRSQLFPCIQICKWEHREMMAARFFWENTGEESMVQGGTLSPAEESPFIRCWGLIGACMGRSYWRPGKETSSGSGERISRTASGLSKLCVPARVENLRHPKTAGTVLRNVLSGYSSLIGLGLKTVLALPNKYEQKALKNPTVFK